MNYRVESAEYEGPLEGLLSAARSRDQMLSSLSLTSLIQDFLEYLRENWNGELDRVSESLLVFSELIRIKTRLLLPDPPVEETDVEQERDLGPPAFFQQAAERLRRRAHRRSRLYDTNPDLPETVEKGETRYREVTLYELIRAFQNVVVTRRQRGLPDLEITDEWDTNTQMEAILRRVSDREPRPFHELLTDRPSREEVIVTFLSILQLVKQNELRLVRRAGEETILVISVGDSDRDRLE